MNAFKLCAFADEADSQLDGQIRALTENGISYIELRGLDSGPAVALSDREKSQNVWTMQEFPSGQWGLRLEKSV